MRAGRLDTPADLLRLDADVRPCVVDWLWIGIRAKEAGDVQAPSGLRNPGKVEVRAWWDDRLQIGRYLRAGGRLLLIDSVRDVTGDRAEAVITCSELVGLAGQYRPQDGIPVSCRVHLTHEAPYRDEMGQVTEYRTKAEVALIEVGRPQVDDQLVIDGARYSVIAYADETDDGVVRGLWLEKV